IRADTRTVSDVCSLNWNGIELRKRLLVGNEPIVYFDFHGDRIGARAIANVHANGKRPIKDGFELLGRRFYGNALILADDGRTSPRVTPKQIAPAVYFFREDGH
ncbi:MAG TPA: hypothetical protein VGM54_06595, partial [Chthoniobacter sp.]